MCLVPGVKDCYLTHTDEGVRIEVSGGNSKVVAAMIVQCVPPGTPTVGDTEVEGGGIIVRFVPVDPTPDEPADYVAPLPLADPEGTHRPMGPQLAISNTVAASSKQRPLPLWGSAALVAVLGFLGATVVFTTCDQTATPSQENSK